MFGAAADGTWGRAPRGRVLSAFKKKTVQTMLAKSRCFVFVLVVDYLLSVRRLFSSSSSSSRLRLLQQHRKSESIIREQLHL